MHIIKYNIKYNSDTHNKDLSSKISYNKDILFIEILQKANELKAVLIVKTSNINNDKLGTWYIKGYNNYYTFKEIKSKIKKNVKNKKYTK